MIYDVCSPVSLQLFENHKNIFLHSESRINFTAMTCTTVPYNDDSSPLFDVLSYVIKNEFLYDIVRNKIGAYGVNAVHNSQTGTFVISSYRDPNPTECLQAFKKAIEICASGEEIDDEMIDRAIMRIFVKLDRPVSPCAKGFLEFNGKTKEIESKRRNIILKATKQQIVDVAKLLKEKDWRYGIFSNKETFNPPEGLEIIKLNELYC